MHNTTQSEQMEIYGWAKACKRFWFTVLHLVTYFFTAIADHAMEIAERAIALTAPAPNAISIYRIAQSELGYNWIAAGIMAAVIELIGFYLIHRSLALLEPLLLEVNRQTLTKFVLSAVAVFAGVGIVIGFVYHMEEIGDGHTVMAWWPVLTLCVFLVQGLHQWNETTKRKRSALNTAVRTAAYSGNTAVNSSTAAATGLTDEQLQWLRDHPKSKAKAMADYMGVDKTTVVRKLQPYINEGIVIVEQQGQTNLYSLSPDFELPILPASAEPHTNGHAVLVG